MAKNKNVGKPRNYTLASGVYRFSRSKTFHKKAIYKFLKKTTPKKEVPKKRVMVEKQIGGAKNGGKRLVRVKKLPNHFSTANVHAKRPRASKCFKNHKRSLRSSLQAGSIAIVLAGVHKGKRVVVLKQLATGLLLVTGPFKLNGCPLRRINQRYLIGTSTKIDVSGVKLGEHINDAYFRRVRVDSAAAKKSAATKKDGGEIFVVKKEKYKASEQRKKDQVEVDKQVLQVIKKHPEAVMLKAYLKSIFSLSKGQYPHRLIF